MLVGLDALLQHLHAIAFGGCFGADGGVAFQVLLLDDFGTQGGVLAFHDLDAGMSAEELAALHQGDGVGVDFGDVVPIFIGQADKAVRDAQFVFAYNLCAALTQQFVVVQQAAGNGVFYRQHADGLAVLLDGIEDFFEAGAAD